MVLSTIFGSRALGQEVNLDSLNYTTAKVKLVKRHYTGCHVATSYYTFEVLKHMAGPKVEKGTLIESMLLTNDITGDGYKLDSELYYGKADDKGSSNELVINFTYNPNPKPKPELWLIGCTNHPDYFDYGISYIRWAVREERLRDMLSLDMFMQQKFNRKFHLLAEREGKFLFEENGKQLLAFKMYQEWQLAEVTQEN